MPPVPTIVAIVNFLLPEQGGRQTPVYDAPGYRPHLVVGETNQRIAVVTGDREWTESFLGVQFTGNGTLLAAGEPHTVQLALPYFPGVDYSGLLAGVTFTIREGPFVVGFGHIVEGLPNKPLQPTSGGNVGVE
jgi:hypothetical protein